jgi:hypothetical protein
LEEPISEFQTDSNKDSLATAALITSIVSVVSIFGTLAWWWFGPLALLTAVAGIILGYLGRSAPRLARQARIVMIISGICLALLILYLAFLLFVFGFTYVILGDPEFWEMLWDGFN